MPRSAVIVGAGIGGLALGRALVDDGWQIRILERADGLPETGTALGIWPEALTALDQLGVGDRARAEGVAQFGAQMLRPDGSIVGRVTAKESTYLLSRPKLHQILHSEALESHIEWETPIDNVAELPEADLVVGADGLRSKVRNHVTVSGIEPRSLGCVAFRGTVPGAFDRVTETWGNGRLFGVTPNDSHSTNWFACIRDDKLDELAIDSSSELLRVLFGDWHPAIQSVVHQLDDSQVDRRRLYDLPRIRSMVRGNSVIIGDAAHAMAPNMGRGACETLIDAAALADELRREQSVEIALESFDRKRRKPGQKVMQMSRTLNKLSMSRHLLKVRHQLIGTLSRFA